MARESNDDATRKIMKGLGINDEDLKVGFEKLSKTPRDEIMKVAAKAALVSFNEKAFVRVITVGLFRLG